MDQPSPSSSQTPHSSPPVRHGSPWWLVLAALVSIGAVVFMQQGGVAASSRAANRDPEKGLGKITPPRTGFLVMYGKFLITIHRLGAKDPNAAAEAEQADKTMLAMVDSIVGWLPANETGFLSPAHVDKNNPPLKLNHPYPAADRLRAAILAGEVAPPDEVAWRLEDVERTLAPESPLVNDVEAVRVLLRVPDKDGHVAAQADVDPVTAAGLRERHGWFAELALAHGVEDAPVRVAAAASGWALLVAIIVFFSLIGLGAFAGFVLGIIALVNWGKVRRAFARPRPETEWPVESGEGVVDQHGFPVPAVLVAQRGGSVWLETLAVFLTGFLAIKLIVEALARSVGEQEWITPLALALQGALAVCIFWPVVRGMSWERWRGEIGWHSGRGLWREVGAGLFAYLITLPIFIVFALVVVTIVAIASRLLGADPPGADTNRVTDILGGGTAIEVAMFGLLAVVWAPIVEESIFRGALYRHLRRRTGVALAALLSAAAFAVVHGYPWFLLGIVGLLGVSFAIMREWRGSLIPSATAHALHNGFITLMLVTIFTLASV